MNEEEEVGKIVWVYIMSCKVLNALLRNFGFIIKELWNNFEIKNENYVYFLLNLLG